MQQTPQDILITRLEGLRRALELTDRVLSGQKATLKFNLVCAENAEPALSYGSDIQVNVGLIRDLGSNSALVKILGLNYHEVGHVRYGVNPGRLSSLLEQTNHRFLEAFQVVEEARIETLLSAKYEKMKKYFTYAVVEFFVEDKRTWDSAFLFTHGRKYLPSEIRRTFREIFEKTHGKKVAREFADLIDEYRILSFRKEPGRAEGARIIDEFAKLLGKLGFPELAPHKSGRTKQSGVTPDSDTEDDAEQAKRQSIQQEEEEAQEDTSVEDKEEETSEEEEEDFEEEPDSESEEDDDDGEEEDDSEDESDSGSDDVSSGVGQDNDDQSDDESGSSDQDEEDGEEPEGSDGGEDQEEDPSSGDGARGDSDSESQDDADQDSDGEGGDEGDDSDGLSEGGDPADGVGSCDRAEGSDDTSALDSEELEEALAELISGVLDNEEVQADLDHFRGAMEDESSLSSLLDRHPSSKSERLIPVTLDMIQESARLGDVLRQLWAQMEPGWKYGLSEGTRIDMNRAATVTEPDDYDSIYVDWEEGQQENSGIEVVIAADESGSMSGLVGEETSLNLPSRGSILSKNVWELMFALHEVDAAVTVLTYSNMARTLYDRNDQVSAGGYAEIKPSGGTNPTPAVKEARRILTMSEMKHKVFIVISDGEWGRNSEISRSLEILDEALKVMILIGNGGMYFSSAYTSQFDVVALTTGSVFEPMAEAVVKLTERNMER